MESSARGLRAGLSQEKDDERRANLTRGLHLCRLWAVLAESRQHEGQSLYPVELVAPRSIDEVYFQVAGSERTPWDRSLQHVALESRPELCLRHADIGFSFDLFNTSHRIESERYLASARERRKNGKDSAAPAGKKSKGKPKEAEVQAEA